MKTTKFLLASLFVMSMIILPSCLDDDDYDMSLRYPNALVTVKETADDKLFFQLDDQTTLLPVNINTHPYGGKEVRALVNYKEVDVPSGDFDKAVHVNWIDSIRTKPMAPNLGDQNDEKYGNDPVEIVRDWVTIAEDGYLTLRFRTLWSNMGVTHHVNLIPTNNPENPYEVEFRHDAKGDVGGRMGDGLVAFKLDDLPDTEGETVKLKLIWNAFNGGNSQIILVKNYDNMEIIGKTIDDAAGEAFDKCAKVMGLGYPGGPVVDRLAKMGNSDKYIFSKPRLEGYDYSFSGLKTSFLYFLRDELKQDSDFIEKNKNDLCASLQKTIVDILMDKLLKASEDLGIKEVAVAGGVSANSSLRSAFEEYSFKYGWRIHIPKFAYTTDNAAMVAISGYYKYLDNEFVNHDVAPYARVLI
jgi:hypothetical protein